MRLARSLLLDAPGEPGRLTVYKAVTACRFSFALCFDDCGQNDLKDIDCQAEERKW